MVAASMEGENPWTDVTYIDALIASKGSAEYFGYEDGIKTNIMNSYAWDTALAWLNKTLPTTYSSSLNHGNYSGTMKPTGGTSSDKVNNICDMAGNVREWTSETYKGKINTKKKNSNKKNQSNTVLTRVVRGGGATLNKTASGYTAYEENTSEAYWGFRMVLYKM